MKKLLAILTLAMLMSLAIGVPVALAQTNGDIPVQGEDFTEKLQVLWGMLVSYVIAGLVWALSGFFKVKDPQQDTFDPVQFLTTVVIGAVTGVLVFAIYTVTGESLQPSTIVGYLLAIGFVGFIETWVKVFWRRIKPYFTPSEEPEAPEAT